MPAPMTRGALSRFRVLDLTQARAGPACARQFADFGADVIRIEPHSRTGRSELYTGGREGGDMQNLHRNKRSIVLDLKSQQGRSAFMQLVRSADVVMENFRPDVKERLGIDYDALCAVNPRIVLASISGFGQDGPYRDRPGFDQVLQGMCGLMSTTGHSGEGPMRAGAAVIDMTAGFIAAIGIFTALLERESSGKGQWVQNSLLHAGVALMDFQAARYLVDGQVATQAGNDHPTSMPTSAYPVVDGYINIGVGSDAMWGKLCAEIGRPELSDHPDFAVNDRRVENRLMVNQILSDAFAAGTTQDWIERLNRVGVPCGPIYTMDQVFNDPQVRHCGIAAEAVHPVKGPIRLVAQAAILERTPAELVSLCGPKGEHTREVLQEAGFSDKEIDALIAANAIEETL